MDLGSIFLILALLMLVGIFISQPLLERQGAVLKKSSAEGDIERSVLLAERDRLLTALQELDFDYTLGKIPEEDYPGQRQALLQRGADVLRQLDKFQAETGLGDAEARVEAAIAARRADARAADGAVVSGNGARPPVAAPDDELEALIANRRRVRQEKAAGFCPQCGGPLQKSDLFCPKCGARLT